MKEPYDIASISNKTLSQIQILEKQLREETGEELILIAYKDQSPTKKI
ncbi:MAG: hypothetical protein ACI4XL_07740 [Bacillus sp. (in: firmicutes)]